MKMMKYIVPCLLALIFCKTYAHENFRNLNEANYYHTAHHAHISGQQTKLEKKYIHSNQVRFDEKDIYVQLDENWIITNAVYTDSNGFYILEVKGGWTCGNCSYYNEGNNWTCDNCGRKRE